MNKLQTQIQYLIIIGIIIVVNLILAGFFVRFDLTKEKRYSLTDLSLETMETLIHPMTVTVYLEGDFPPNVREFQDAIQTTLGEMAEYATADFDFQFVDPNPNPELTKEFQQKGYSPVPIKVRISATETKDQIMWPLARVVYKDTETYIDLIKGSTVMTVRGPNVNFAQAEADLEYTFTSSFRKVIRRQEFLDIYQTGDSLGLRKDLGIVAFLQGHGELPIDSVPELVRELSTNYTLYTFDLQKTASYDISPSIDVLIIMNPTQTFSERDKYEIDQYLIRGGNVLWIMDQEIVDLSLYRNQSTLTELRELNVDDMFFRYGLKVNYDLIQDQNSELTEVLVPGEGGRATFASKRWIFYPMVLDFPQHPISRNVDAVLLRYAASIDTFATPGLTKEVFLKTSPRSRTIQGVQFLDLNEYLSRQLPDQLFNRREGVITGVVAKGIFSSNFQGRTPPTDSLAPNPPKAKFGPQNNPDYPGQMAIISDGSIALGKRFRGRRGYIPYDNKTLILNAIDYLAGDEALTQIRSKQVGVRRINREKAADHAVLLRVLNVGIPVLLIVGFALVRGYLRRKRNAAYQKED